MSRPGWAVNLPTLLCYFKIRLQWKGIGGRLSCRAGVRPWPPGTWGRAPRPGGRGWPDRARPGLFALGVPGAPTGVRTTPMITLPVSVLCRMSGETILHASDPADLLG